MKKCNMCGSFVSDKATQCPKCGVEIKEDIIPEVKVPEVHMPEVKEVKEETWAWCGEGAVRTADYLLEKYRQLTGE